MDLMPLLFKERKKSAGCDDDDDEDGGDYDCTCEEGKLMTMKMVVITIPPVRTGQSETTTVPTRTPLNWVKPF